MQKRFKKPKTETDVSNVEFERIAEENNLTVMQTKFCYFYVFLTNYNGPKAAELAGYSSGKSNENYDDVSSEYYKNLTMHSQANDVLASPRVVAFITKLHKEVQKNLLIDQFYVTKNLKRLAETGNESTQLRALELLGKTFEMFGDKQIIEEREDPAKIASAKFEKRKQDAMKNTTTENIVQFAKES